MIRGGLCITLGSLLWIASWIVVWFVGGGSQAERIWRTVLLNPALLLFMAGLAGLHASQAGRSGRWGKWGYAGCLLGTGIMLLGNVVEFWVSEVFFGTQTPGWLIMGIGLMVLPVGFIVLGIGTLRAGVLAGWRGAVPLGFGFLLALLVTDLKVVGLTPWIYGAVGIGLGWTALGLAMCSQKDTPARGRFLAMARDEGKG